MHVTFKSPRGSYWWPGSYGAPCLNFCHCLGSCWQGVWKRISITGFWRLLDKEGAISSFGSDTVLEDQGGRLNRGCFEIGGCAWNSERGFYWDLQTKRDFKNIILIFILHFFWNVESSWIWNCLLVQAITVITGQVTIGLLALKVYS